MFVALGIQNSMRTHLIVICGLSGCTVFSPHCLKWHNFGGGGDIGHKMCVLTSSTTLSETCLILRRIEKDMNKNICWC